MSDLVEQVGAGDVGETAGCETAPAPMAVAAVPSDATVQPTVTRRPRPRRSAEDEATWRAIVALQSLAKGEIAGLNFEQPYAALPSAN